jgi:hypothetical protein
MTDVVEAATDVALMREMSGSVGDNRDRLVSFIEA